MHKRNREHKETNTVNIIYTLNFGENNKKFQIK